uniref:Integrator complex subunit 3 homolog n=1 Tax=Rhizophora mucronata TaxID=61149 RepID=A0A2P2QN90_RHIMU
MASRLLKTGTHEAQNELELSMRQAFEELEPKLRPPFPLAIPNPQEYSQLNRALLYGVLTEPHLAKTHIKHLHAFVTDGYEFFVGLILRIVDELYAKLVDPVRVQLISAVKEMVDVLGVGCDRLFVSLLRQIVGGDSSDGNLWLCFELVGLFLSKFGCLIDEKPLVLTSALYVYLRLLADHCRVSGNPKVEFLKQLEIEFCVKMIRENFSSCMKIGRDLIRLLQDLFHVPDFRALWRDLVLSPGEFNAAGFSDISQLYCIRTSSRYFLLRITPEMEIQLRFLLSHVKFGDQKRYQVWFAKKFLFGPERETLVSDIVRFICCAHHPSNEIIHSKIVPRWAAIGWLMSTCGKNYVTASVKLALFYDWLFFDERVDNIMSIEPAMLLMVCSMPKYMGITRSLLDFLLLLVDNYDVDRKDIIIKGISSAFGALVRKGVVQSLDV